ncbi:MAG: 4'-phosphopantetheinyl transferase superfamily protein [Bacteroidaceae bacterium]|nr:4'-phosphopantetheinyl transferase superfamily protein [Bacteroidaceae bacterium]
MADISALLSDEALQAEAASRLSESRRTRTQAMGNVRSRCLSLGVGLLLDQLLAEVGLRERDMEYTEGPHGKPEIKRECLGSGMSVVAFNLSHSVSMVAAALLADADGYAIGIDIQRITRYRPELVRRAFPASAREQLAAATNDTDREQLFAKMWSRNEAYAKATGDGLQMPSPIPPSNAVFFDFQVGEDYWSTLCILSPSTP